MKIAIIGNGAISTFVQKELKNSDVEIVALLVRKGKELVLKNRMPCYSDITKLPKDIGLLVDCAGHEALNAYAIDALNAGVDVLTVSLGALADKAFEQKLQKAADDGDATLHLTSGAIGGLDALRSANIGKLDYVKYIGRKPPKGWIGSPAEGILDLKKLNTAETHFKGSAREAALLYPKNANVAAAVALSSLGFDDTQVELIADPSLSANIHQIEAQGEFGELSFMIKGNSLASNPRSSALAAMSMVNAILAVKKKIKF